MNRTRFLAAGLSIILLTGIFTIFNIAPVRAACSGTCWVLNQDAANTGQTDIAIQSSASDAHSFGIGAVLTNASSTNPLTLYGWQFAINYNATEFTPQGDPTTGAYPDGAAATALFGAQTAAGTVNWAGLLSSGKALSATNNVVNGAMGKYLVAFTTIAPNPAVTISATTLFASVSFELNGLSSPSTQNFSLSDVIFVDSNSNTIPGVGSGGPVSETITDVPPVASASATHEPAGSSDCVPVTGTTCTSFAFKFDGSGSTSPSGTIANPSGYFWDFGDGSQDLGITGSIVVHDYRAFGTFNVTLRVVDTAGDTGSARDSLGNVILNKQPSHTLIRNLTSGTPNPTRTSVSCSPVSVIIGATVSCTATVTDTSTGPITPTGSVTFTSSGAGTFSPGSSCTLGGSGASASCTISFTPSATGTDTISANYGGDPSHMASTATATINVNQAPSITSVSCTPSTLKAGSPTTCTATVVGNCSGTCPIPTGTVSFTSIGAGTFSSISCILVSGTSSASCSVTFTPSTSGTDTITASYGGNSNFSASSGTTTIRVHGRGH